MSAEEMAEALADVEALLSSDPDNAELREVVDELRRAAGGGGGGDRGDGGEEEEALLVGVGTSGEGAGGKRKRDDADAADAADDADEDGNDGDDGDGGGDGGDDDVDNADPGGDLINRAPNSDKMHPRNVYNETNPDFAKLAERQPFLRPFLKKRGKGRVGIDFTQWVGLGRHRSPCHRVPFNSQDTRVRNAYALDDFASNVCPAWQLLLFTSEGAV
jgi:hypothetical protein